MKSNLRGFWENRSKRERVIVIAAGLLLCTALCLWLLHSGNRERARLRSAILALRAQASAMEQQAAELGRLRDRPPSPTSNADLLTLVRGRIDAAGLSALARVEVKDSTHVQVVFGSVSFADWLAWADSLQSQQVRLEACRIEALSAPGAVSVTATFVRAQQS